MTSLNTTISYRHTRRSEFSIHVAICTAGFLNFMTMLCFLPVFSSLEATIMLSLIIVSNISHLIGVHLTRAAFLLPNILLKMLLATFLTITTFSLNRERPDDAMSLTLWMTITVVWLIAETHLMTAICFQYISSKEPVDDQGQLQEQDNPPDYEQVIKSQKTDLPSYAEYLKLYVERKRVFVIDVETLEGVLEPEETSHSSSSVVISEGDSH